MNIVGLIPARGGSKGIPRKSHVRLGGKPLLTYTLQAAQKSKLLSRVLISTDDKKAIALAKRFGVEAPFIRPRHLATDKSRIVDVIRHTFNYLEKEEHYPVDAIVLLQPTSPLRKAEHIDEAIRLFIRRDADTVVSVVPVPHRYNPVSVMVVEKSGHLKPFREGPLILRRQDKPLSFARNGPAILVMKRSVLKKGQLYGWRVIPYLMSESESVDIDSPADLKLAEFWLKNKAR